MYQPINATSPADLGHSRFPSLPSSQHSHSHSRIVNLVESAADLVDEVSTLLGAEGRKAGTEPHRPIHTVTVVFNLLNTTMGVGILSLGAVFAYSGLVLGSFIMVACAIATYFSVTLMIRVVEACRAPCDPNAYGIPTFEQMAEYCLGTKGRLWVQASLIGICLGTLIAFSVSMKALLYEGLEQIIPGDTLATMQHHGFNANTCMVLGTVTIALPLSLLRKIDGLWFTSLLSVAALLYFVVMTVVYLLLNPDDSGKKCHELVTNHDKDVVPSGGLALVRSDGLKLLQAVSITSMSYICQLTVFPILRELTASAKYSGSPSPVHDGSQQLSRSTLYTMLVACVLYCTAGLTGYITWKDLTAKPTTILACYPTDDRAVIVVYFGMVLVLLFSYPLILFTCRLTVASIMFPSVRKGIPLSLFTHVAVTLAIVVPVGVVSSLANQLTTVLGIASALTSPSLCFLLPGVCYLRAQTLERAVGFDEDSESNFDGDGEAALVEQCRHRLMSSGRALGWGMVILGGLMQIACLAAAVAVTI